MSSAGGLSLEHEWSFSGISSHMSGEDQDRVVKEQEPRAMERERERVRQSPLEIEGRKVNRQQESSLLDGSGRHSDGFSCA